eukprot:7616032-Pyramimonas_sp.AAC.1
MAEHDLRGDADLFRAKKPRRQQRRSPYFQCVVRPRLEAHMAESAPQFSLGPAFGSSEVFDPG